MLRHENGPLRAEACDAPALLEGPAARKAVLEAFQDPDVTPMQALVRTDAREAIPELRKRMGAYAEFILPLVDLDAREALPQIFALLDQPEKAAAFHAEGLRAAARGFPKESLPSLRINLATSANLPFGIPLSLLCPTVK